MATKSVLVKLPFNRNFRVNIIPDVSKSDFTLFKEAFTKVCKNDVSLSKILSDDTKHFVYKKYDDLFQCQVELTDFDEINHGTTIEANIVSTHEISVLCDNGLIEVPQFQVQPLIESVKSSREKTNYEELKFSCDKDLNLASNSVQPLIESGKSSREKTNYEEIESICDKDLNLASNSVQPLVESGKSSREKTNYEEIKFMCDKALNLASNSAETDLLSSPSNLSVQDTQIFNSTRKYSYSTPQENTCSEDIKFICEKDLNFASNAAEIDLLSNAIEETLIPKYSTSRGTTTTPTVTVRYNCPLPKFSRLVMDAIRSGVIADYYNLFIRECANALLNMTERPHRLDYDNFCRTIGDHYPFINDDSFTDPHHYVPYWSFKKALTQSIRNGRYYRRKIMKARNIDKPESSSVKIFDESTIVDEHRKEMEKCLSENNVDKVHFAYLMLATFDHRRDTIFSLDKISDMQQMYPGLKFPDWILFDFNKITHTTNADRKKNFQDAMEKVSKLKACDFNDDTKYLAFMKWVESSVSKNMSCMEIRKVGDPRVTPCEEKEAPHLVVYLDHYGSISNADILAQEGVVLSFQKASVFELLECLMGVYYVFDYEYPSVYAPFLLFLQFIILRKKLVKREVRFQKLVKFLKKLNL